MTHQLRRRPLIRSTALLLVLASFVSSCASVDAYKEALSERDQEILRLHEERSDLRRQQQGLSGEVRELQVRLQEANARATRQTTATPEAPRAASRRSAELDAVGISSEDRGNDVVYTVPSAITFPSGSATLSKDGQKALRELAKVLQREHPRGIFRIEGHTDSDPIQKSKFANNRELSIARGMAVLTFLVEECGVSDTQCVITGFGPHRPREAGSGADSKARNRRVEVVVTRS
jgi:chemotaxis protein MotB